MCSSLNDDPSMHDTADRREGRTGDPDDGVGERRHRSIIVDTFLAGKPKPILVIDVETISEAAKVVAIDYPEARIMGFREGESNGR
jgi:hypothetical protein